MPVWSIVLLVIIAILVVALIALIIVGNKLRKKQTENQAQIDAAKQIMSMLIIDKKKMKLKEAGLPKIVLEQTPKYLQRSKVPVVKAKIGPKVMTLMADPKVYDQIPIKAEVKAEVSGIYITGIKSVRGTALPQFLPSDCENKSAVLLAILSRSFHQNFHNRRQVRKMSALPHLSSRL